MADDNGGPGSRVRELLNRDGERVDAVVGQSGLQDFSLPDNPGPRVLGRTPILGQMRRERDLPVARDRLSEMLE